MSRVTILSFTDRGDALAQEIRAVIGEDCGIEGGLEAASSCTPSDDAIPRDPESIRIVRRSASRAERRDAVRDSFDAAGGDRTLIFLGALGIAVRLIAPFVGDKYSDPAVLVLDDHAHHVISVLSGHGGGANDRAIRLAAALRARGYRARDVITTATDVRGAINAEQILSHYGIPLEPNRLRIKEINSAIANRPAGAPVPEIRIVHIGTGCKRDTPPEKYRRELDAFLADHRILPETIASLNSIDLKADEPAVLEAAKALGVAVRFFAAEELQEYEAVAPASDFVKSVTGVASVAGASAAAGSGGGRLLTEVRKGNGCTFCAAIDRSMRMGPHDPSR
ncbi:MAG: cobalamin biosynthesis protein [Bacillota bacterium]|nr:cobalamin biosynthesis protein [Bacillota bacterium]